MSVVGPPVRKTPLIQPIQLSPVAPRRLPWESGGGGGATGLPLTIAGIKSWHRADSLVTHVAGVVSAIGDLSGNGRTLSNAGADATKPTLVAANAEFNGRATLSFDGGDTLDDALASYWNFLHNGTGMTLVVVAKGDAANTIYGFVSTTTSTTARGTRLRTTGTGNLIWDMGNGTANIMNQTVLVNLDASLFKATVRYEEGRAGNEYAHRINGSADTTGDSAAAAPSASDATIPLSLSGTTLPLTGDIAEVITYSRYLTDAEVNTLDAYLLARYGV